MAKEKAPGPEGAIQKAKRRRTKKGQQAPAEPSSNGHAESEEAKWLTPACNIPDVEIEWMVHPYLPFGNVVLLTGPVGVGKSSFLAAVAAEATGAPAFRPGESYKPGRAVLYFVVEEDPGLLVKPRLDVAECDLSKVHFVGYDIHGRLARKLTLPRDQRLLAKLIRASGANVVIFDPINSFLDEGLEGTRTEHVRPVMDALAAVAADTKALILLVMHFRKSKEGTAVDWVAGSAAWVQCARLVLVLAPHPNDDDKRVLAVSKAGIVKQPPARFYTLIDKGKAAKFCLGLIADVDAMELTGQKADRVDAWKRDMAKAVLKEELESGEKPVKQLIQRCTEMGIGERTVHRAARELNVPHETRSEGAKNVTYWKKPEGGFKD